MPGLNCTWDEAINQSDGRYLTDSELQKMQHYLQTFNARSKTYEILRDKSDILVKIALKKFMLLHPEIMQKHSQRCLYDMNMAMCVLAASLLRDDQQFFKENLILWQANILAAYQKSNPCLQAYNCLQEVIKEHLPAPCNQLIKPYMDIMLEALDTHPKLMATVQRGGFPK